MTYATDKQIAFIARLAQQAGFASTVAAVDAYSLGIKSASSLTVSEASQMIDWLKSGATPVDTTPAPELGARFASAKGDGKIITRLSDGRYLVKFDDGRSDFLAASEFMN